MTSNKKVLIVSCNAGSGHIRAAEALFLTCCEKYPDTQVKHIDLINYSNFLFKLFITSSYSFLVAHWPNFYGHIYYATNTRFFAVILREMAAFLSLNSKGFRAEIERFAPDVIISTYFLPPILVPAEYQNKFYTLVTDYHLHHVWTMADKGKIFAATEEVKKEIENIVALPATVTGLPVHPKFKKVFNREELIKKYNLSPGLPTILIMPCDSGRINVEEMVRKIIDSQKANIIAISGKGNHSLLEQLKRMEDKNKQYQAIEFSNEIEDLFAVSDIVITKAGGLTLTECLYLKKPIIIVNPIPGQEDCNTQYIEKNNYGLKAKNANEVIDKLQKIIDKKIVFSTPNLPPNPNEHILSEALKNLP